VRTGTGVIIKRRLVSSLEIVKRNKDVVWNNVFSHIKDSKFNPNYEEIRAEEIDCTRKFQTFLKYLVFY
jgi:hypothetical protein